MTRVLLINPQMPFNEKPGPTNNYGWIKLGIAYLSSALKEAGHEVGLLDLRHIKGWNGIIPEVKNFNPDIVSISATTADVQDAIHIADMIKHDIPHVVTIVGGIHASIAPDDFKTTGLFNWIIRGEGEISVPHIADIVDAYHDELPINHVMWGETPDINALPFPDRNLWQNYREIINTNNHLKLRTPWAQVIVNRGCGFGCKYCCGPGEQNHFKPIRGRSVENVISELHHLQDTYRINSVQYLDDQFIMNPEWVWKFCYTLEDHGLDNIQYWAASRADIILRNKDLVLRMRDTGLEIMSVGFESFSNHLLKFWNKGVTAEQNMEAAMFLKEHDIKIFSNTILGSPREDGKWYIEDDMATVEAIEKIKPTMASRTIFNPIIGSELYQWCHEKGLVDVDSGVHNKPVKGVNLRKVRMMMDRIWCDRPWHHRMYDKVMDVAGLP